MVFWILAIVVTAIACAVLYYAAASRPVNAAAPEAGDATAGHFRLQLKELARDIESGRLGEAEGLAARGEIARELIRLQAEGARRTGSDGRRQHLVMIPAIVLTAGLALGVYAVLGNPQLPSLPLAGRVAPEPFTSLDDAVARIEAQLAETPDDVRGWSVIAPVYMRSGRFADAEQAFRRVIEIAGATADTETDLAEAIMMARGGSAEGEPLTLFRSAAARDPQHVRSRFYLASEAMRSDSFETAVQWWNELLALASGDEAWVATARAGLDQATAGLAGEAAIPDAAAIEGMVEGLAARLDEDGGSIEEWTRLVRSRLVLGQTERALAAYEAARAAHPDATTRIELDVLAADNGLVAREGAD
jgi:cytochrome c-type biogenesis protein CcmH